MICELLMKMRVAHSDVVVSLHIVAVHSFRFDARIPSTQVAGSARMVGRGWAAASPSNLHRLHHRAARQIRFHGDDVGVRLGSGIRRIRYCSSSGANGLGLRE